MPALPPGILDKLDERGRRCELRASVSSGALRYLACGDAGLWIVRIKPGGAEVIEQRATLGSATGFFLRDGVLWVESTTLQAQRIASIEADAVISQPPPTAAPAGTAPGSPTASAPATPAVPAPAAPVAPAPATPAALDPNPYPNATAPVLRRAQAEDMSDLSYAKVVALEPGVAIIDMGAQHGVMSGDRVAFDTITRERVDAQHTAARRDRVAVGRVTAIAEGRTRIELGVGERVPIGALAYPTRDPVSASSFAPERLGGLWHASFLVRPFLVVDNLGAGVAFDGRIGYRWASPIHLEALVQPLALATGKQGFVSPLAALLAVSFDSRLFEIGLGVGGQTFNQPAFDLESGSGTTLAQRVRIGSVDGGMVEVFTYITLFHREFLFSDVRAFGQLPLGERTWLVINGGAGELGFGYGEIGLRVLLEGNGDIGSWFLTAVIGAAHVFEDVFCASEFSNCSFIDYVGPMAGAGAEFRF